MGTERELPSPWRSAGWGALLTIVVGMSFTLVVMPAIKGWHHDWWVVGEVWPPMRASGYVVNGAYPYLYEADRAFVATPLGAIALAPVAEIGQAFRLTDNYLIHVPRPTLWLVYGPYGLGLSALVLLAAVRMLAFRVAPPGAGDPRGRGLLWAQVATFALVLIPAAIVFGHFEEVLALGFLLLAIRAELDERWARAALLLGVAIAFKQWALLAVPLFVVRSPRGLRFRVLRLTLVLPVALVVVPLAVDWSHASLALFRPLSFPQLGHAALWVHRTAAPIVGTPTRLAAVAVAIGLAAWLREHRSPAVLLASLALILLARVWLEPVAFAYYLCPALALLFLHDRAMGTSGVKTVVVGCAWEAFFLLHPDPVLWWSVSAGVTTFLASGAVAEVWRAVRSTRVSSEALALEPSAATGPIH